MRRLLALVLLLITEIAFAQIPRRIPDIYFGTRSWLGCASVTFNATDIPMSVSNGRCTVDLGANIFESGACIGAHATDHCTTVLYDTRILDQSLATQVKGRICQTCSVDTDCSTASNSLDTASLCVDGRCGPGAEGSSCWHSELNTWLVGDAAKPVPIQRGLGIIRLGGDGSDGAFTYAGEATANCTGSVCNGGTCTNVAPPGNTCTLTANSILGRMGGYDAQYDGTSANTGSESVLRNYTTITVTAGTVKPPAALTGNNRGVPVILRATGAVSITGGTFDFRGFGTVGAASGLCNAVGAQVGKAGGNSFAANGGAGGSNAGGDGVIGNAGTGTDPAITLFAFPSFMGTGGGTCPNASGATATAGNNGMTTFLPGFGSTGGGGGGCSANCTTQTTCGAGGNGGGFLRIESAKSITLGGSVSIDVRGSDGTQGSGGGGGGGVHILSPLNTSTLTNDTTTCAASTPRICYAGGAAGGSKPTNCGNAKAGATGVGLVQTTAPL